VACAQHTRRQSADAYPGELAIAMRLVVAERTEACGIAIAGSSQCIGRQEALPSDDEKRFMICLR
jgi:hypothetical protein